MNPTIRDVATFILGFAGIVHQTVFAGSPQPVLVGAFLAMMFGSAFVGKWLDRQ